MKPRQLLISVYPAAWEWMPTLVIALLGVSGLAAGITGAPVRLIHSMLGLLAALRWFLHRAAELSPHGENTKDILDFLAKRHERVKAGMIVHKHRRFNQSEAAR